MLAAWLGCYEGLLTLRSIAVGLRLRSSGRTADLIRFCDCRLDRDKTLQTAIDRLRIVPRLTAWAGASETWAAIGAPSR
jgi:hypothetical protein